MDDMKKTRPISWIKAAHKDFEEFPQDVQNDMLDALTIAATGGKSDNSKPFKGIVFFYIIHSNSYKTVAC